MTGRLQELLAAAPVVTDGAWGTQLQNRGLGLGASAEAWNLDRPAEVEAVARAYVEAGSRVILSNTFGANRIALERHGLAARAAELARLGVRLSQQAATGRALVFASLGPSTRLLMAGEVEEAALRDAFREQAEALAEGGADAIVVETMTDLEEARLAVAAAHETGLPVVGCMVFDSGPERTRTIMGTTPAQAAAALEEAGAEVIGANCGQGIAGFVPVCELLRAATTKPIWVKANAGLPEVVGGEIRYRTTPAEFAAYGPSLTAAGAAFVGGCCGTDPAFIRALAAAVAASP
ncbi:MAG: homocysteine S-methyltransferase family protein [Candidatus Latescibacterota bacterium]